MVNAKGKVMWGPQGPAGNWTVSGKTPQGEPYRGSLSLRKSGNVFVGTFQSEELGGERSCTGIIVNGVFLLARSNDERARPGIVWYTLATNGDLEAVWNSATFEGEMATGRATGGEPGVIPGQRAITYFDPNGNALEPPSLDLIVRQESSVYTLDWKVRGSDTIAFTGVGLDVPNGIASAWNGAAAGPELDILVYKLDASSGGTKADAVWATTSGGRQVGKERIQR